MSKNLAGVWTRELDLEGKLLVITRQLTDARAACGRKSKSLRNAQRDNARLERENARLREELASAKAESERRRNVASGLFAENVDLESQLVRERQRTSALEDGVIAERKWRQGCQDAVQQHWDMMIMFGELTRLVPWPLAITYDGGIYTVSGGPLELVVDFAKHEVRMTNTLSRVQTQRRSLEGDTLTDDILLVIAGLFKEVDLTPENVPVRLRHKLIESPLWPSSGANKPRQDPIPVGQYGNRGDLGDDRNRELPELTVANVYGRNSKNGNDPWL